MSEDGDDVELLSDDDEGEDFYEPKVKVEASDLSEFEDDDDEDECDSDRELQVAFKKGLLKPGLNYAAEAPKTFANDVDGLKQKILEIRQVLKWPERLDLIPSKAQLMAKSSKAKPSIPKKNLSDEGPKSDLEDIDDDFKREMGFCNLAQLAVLEAIPRLHTAGVATKRPEDYFAQMAKSDSHMQRIREKLLQKKTEVENRNRARQLRTLRKESKFIQEEVLKRRQDEKKLLNDAVKKFSKDSNGKEDLENMLAGKKKGRPQPQQGKDKKKQDPKTNKRRDWKNKKFGFGGQKKRSKWNTAESVDDMAAGRRKGNSSSPFARVNQNKRGSAKRLQNKKQRPSKVARSKGRQQRTARAGGRGR